LWSQLRKNVNDQRDLDWLPINEAVKQTQDWLDQQFGPVR
jgi:hypothetical protein